MMKTTILTQPTGLPKAPRLCVVRTVEPDVRLEPREWALWHRRKNHVTITLV